MLKSIFADRRVWLSGMLLLLVWVVCRRIVPVQTGFRWVIDGGYWVAFALVAFFGRAVWPVMSDRWRRAEFGWFEVWVLAGIVVVSGMWIAHEKPGYKILADELILSGTAMGMHYERKAACPNRATDVQGAFLILSRSLDKRPLLFPFLVATVHDVTGYRPENAFYLNIVLSAGFLAVVYLAGWKAGGSRWAGVTAGLLFAGLPLLAQQSTGGGFELLNLLLIAVVCLLAGYYLGAPDKTRLEALVYAGLLLGWTRYESLFFLLPVAVVAVLGWWRSKQVIMSWPLMISPLFLAPLVLQNRLFGEHAQAWQMAGREGVTKPFGLEYFTPNLGHAMAYFFDLGGYLTNSAVFAALGLICLPFFALWIVRVCRKAEAADPQELAWAVCGAGLWGIGAIYMLYFWGTFDAPIISRLSLPVHFLMMLAIMVVGAVAFKNRPRGWNILAAVALAGLMFQGLPAVARQAYRTNYPPGEEMRLRGDFLARLTDRNVLFFDNDSFFWILQKIPATPVKQMALRKEALGFLMRNRAFQDMYIVQSVLVDDQTGERKVDPADDPGPDYELETVYEKRVRTLLFMRVARVMAIKEGGETIVRPKPFVEPLKDTRTEEELEKARVLYMENWIKKLP